MRAGVIDIGSSSIKLTIGEKAENDVLVLESLKNVVPLGKYMLLKERISPKIISQAVAVLEKYKQKLKEYDITNVRVIATTAVREAKNSDIFIDTVLRKTGLAIEVLTVGDIVYYIDAYIYYKLRKTYPIHTKRVLIAELGAGSLDISVMDKGYTLMNIGLPVGTLLLKQMMSDLEGSREEVLEAIGEHIKKEFDYLQRNIPDIQIDDLILIDENYSAYIRSILPDKKTTSKFYQLDAKDAEELVRQLEGRSLDDIAKAYNIPFEFTDTVHGYAIIARHLLTLVPAKYIYILETSLSEALLAQMLFNVELAQKYNKTNQLTSVATFLCKKFNVDFKHAQNVARLSETMGRQLQAYLGLKEEDLLYLILAAYLHDIGMYVHNRAHHKHAEYIISCLNLFRLTEEEIKLIACVARYHRKSPPVKSHLLYQSLPADKKILVQKLSALVRMANALDTSHKQKIQNMEVVIDRNQDVILKAQVKGNTILEKDGFLQKKDMFEEITGNKITLAFSG
jgi:exopolyphosphatase / guanosine-5'-triphosphate,3'-diphosphate pyrophosphatase